MDTKKVKNTVKKVWRFIWEDNSVWSWTVNIILAFVIIKFIVYPGLGFILQTSYPIVAVVSGSMEHKLVHPCSGWDSLNPTSCLVYDKNSYEICGKTLSSRQNVDLDFFWNTCGGFYLDFNISKSAFKSFSFMGGFNKGDIMILYGTKPANIKVGDVIVFTGYGSEPIIHRVINTRLSDGKYIFQTKGDHNSVSYSFEQRIPEDTYLGRAVVRIPWLGYVKIFAVELFSMVR